jgi:4-aminobutyrate--pyruvate transaminase
MTTLQSSETESLRDARWHLHSQTNPDAHEASGPVIITHGEGPYIFDSNGHRYLDAMSGLWSASLGFSNSRLKSAAAKAYDAMGFYHTFSGRSSPAVIDAAGAIAALIPFDDARIFFATSGSEANETMVKLAWLYHSARGEPNRRKIISRKRSFHGSTIVAASLTGLPHMHREFGLPLPGFLHSDTPDLYRGRLSGESDDQYSSRLAGSLERLILAEGAETIAAMIAEPIQAGAGILVPPHSYFLKIQAVLDRYGILMLDDEIVCGFGRTGNWFGAQTVGMRPDIISMAKGLSSSYFPISAVAISPRIYDAVRKINEHGSNLGHGFTNSGHPVGAAIVREALSIYEEMDLLSRVRRMGERLTITLRSAAAKSSIVGDIRSCGMLVGVEIVDDIASKAPFSPAMKIGTRLERVARDNGLMLRMQGETVTFCPPFILTDEQLEEIGDAFERTLSVVEREVREASAA